MMINTNEKLFENISNRFSFAVDYVYGDTIYENRGKKLDIINLIV